MSDWDTPSIERLAVIALQFWTSGDLKALRELTEEEWIPATHEEEVLGEYFTDFVMEAVQRFIAERLETIGRKTVEGNGGGT